MSFWQKVKQTVSLRYLLFGLSLFAVVLVVHYFDSATDIKVKFDETSVTAASDRYSINIPYDIIDTAVIENMPESGDPVDGYDNLVVRSGMWTNDAWGEYCICADLDTTDYIVVRLNDGRVFVFSRKNNAATREDYDKLLSYLNP